VGARLAAAGFPVLNLASVTPSELTSAVQKVTSSDADGVNEYREKARRLARIFRAYGGVEKAAGEWDGWFGWSPSERVCAGLQLKLTSGFQVPYAANLNYRQLTREALSRQ
jgi:hypothetical protein